MKPKKPLEPFLIFEKACLGLKARILVIFDWSLSFNAMISARWVLMPDISLFLYLIILQHRTWSANNIFSQGQLIHTQQELPNRGH
jgi:hypothetical protein